MHHLRDGGMDFFQILSEGKWKAPALQQLQLDLAGMPAAQRSIARQCVQQAVDNAIHNFLFALQESQDRGTGIIVMVDGDNVAAKSDGLHGEVFTEDGWQARYSKYGQA